MDSVLTQKGLGCNFFFKVPPYVVVCIGNVKGSPSLSSPAANALEFGGGGSGARARFLLGGSNRKH